MHRVGERLRAAIISSYEEMRIFLTGLENGAVFLMVSLLAGVNRNKVIYYIWAGKQHLAPCNTSTLLHLGNRIGFQHPGARICLRNRKESREKWPSWGPSVLKLADSFHIRLYPFTWNLKQLRGREHPDQIFTLHQIPTVCPGSSQTATLLDIWGM